VGNLAKNLTSAPLSVILWTDSRCDDDEPDENNCSNGIKEPLEADKDCGGVCRTIRSVLTARPATLMLTVYQAIVLMAAARPVPALLHVIMAIRMAQRQMLIAAAVAVNAIMTRIAAVMMTARAVFAIIMCAKNPGVMTVSGMGMRRMSTAEAHAVRNARMAAIAVSTKTAIPIPVLQVSVLKAVAPALMVSSIRVIRC